MDINKFYQILNFMYYIMIINILWIVFTIIGLGLFGFFPATAAMFAVIRRWLILGDNNFNIFSMFWSFYWKDFLKLNGFAIFFGVVGYLIYFNTAFLILNPGRLQFLIPGALILVLMYLVTLLFFFPVFTHYNLTFFQYVKKAFLIAVVSPLEIIGIVMIGVLLFVLMIWVSGIAPLFVGSVMAIIMTLLTNRSYKRIVRKAELLDSK